MSLNGPRRYGPNEQCLKVRVLYKPEKPMYPDSSPIEMIQTTDNVVHFPKSMLPFSDVLQGFAETIENDDEIIEIPEFVRIRAEAFDFVYPFLHRRIMEPESIEHIDEVTLDMRTTSVHEYDEEYFETLVMADKFRFVVACDYLNISAGVVLYTKYIGRLVASLTPAEIEDTFKSNGCDM